MNLRAPLILALCVLVTLAPARIASGVPRVAPTALATPEPEERFRFDAGAPLVAPAGLAADGSICVGTADGYVHLLAPDGSYLWSYSVRGAVNRRPLRSGSLWFIATSAERIYALTLEGTLYWVFRPPSPVASELAASSAGLAYFVASDRFLYGVSAHGGVSLRAPFGALRAGPTTSSDGDIWAENQAGEGFRVHGQELRRYASGARLEVEFAPPDRLLDPNGGVWHARADGVLELNAPGSTSARSIRLTSTPLLAVAWSVHGQYALVSARDGSVFALAGAQQRSSY